MRSDATPDMNGRRIRKIRDIEDEFEEPFWDVVQGLAEMGNSKSEIARILDYDMKCWFSLLRDVKPNIRWASMGEMNSWKGRKNTEAYKERMRQTQRARAPKYFIGDTWMCFAEAMDRYGLSRQVLAYRVKRKGLRGWDVLQPGKTKAECGRMGAMAKNSRRAWRKAA